MGERKRWLASSAKFLKVTGESDFSIGKKKKLFLLFTFPLFSETQSRRCDPFSSSLSLLEGKAPLGKHTAMPEQEQRMWQRRRRRRRRRIPSLPVVVAFVVVTAASIALSAMLALAQPTQLDGADRVACGAAGCVVTTPRVSSAKATAVPKSAAADSAECAAQPSTLSAAPSTSSSTPQPRVPPPPPPPPAPVLPPSPPRRRRTPPPSSERQNFAASKDGAKVVAANADARKASALLDDDGDTFLRNDCR